MMPPMMPKCQPTTTKFVMLAVEVLFFGRRFRSVNHLRQVDGVEITPEVRHDVASQSRTCTCDSASVTVITKFHLPFSQYIANYSVRHYYIFELNSFDHVKVSKVSCGRRRSASLFDRNRHDELQQGEY
jgi:hypothetical protein